MYIHSACRQQQIQPYRVPQHSQRRRVPFQPCLPAKGHDHKWRKHYRDTENASAQCHKEPSAMCVDTAGQQQQSQRDCRCQYDPHHSPRIDDKRHNNKGCDKQHCRQHDKKPVQRMTDSDIADQAYDNRYHQDPCHCRSDRRRLLIHIFLMFSDHTVLFSDEFHLHGAVVHLLCHLPADIAAADMFLDSFPAPAAADIVLIQWQQILYYLTIIFHTFPPFPNQCRSSAVFSPLFHLPCCPVVPLSSIFSCSFSLPR